MNAVVLSANRPFELALALGRVAVQRSLGVVIATAALVAAHPAIAFGLGELIVKSPLGAPFVGQIALRGEASAGQRLDVSCFRLAEGETNEDLPMLLQASLRLQQSSGETYLVIEGRRPIDEPVVQVNIRVGCGAELKRTYAALLDLPAKAAVQVQPERPVAVAQRPEPVSGVRTAAGWTTGDGDTAASIARSMYPRAGDARRQFLQALRDINPDVDFGRSGKKVLPSGVALEIPDAARVASVELPAPPAPPVPVVAPEPRQPVSVESSTEQKRRSPPASPRNESGGRLADHLVLSGPSGESALDAFDEVPLRLSYEVSSERSAAISENARSVLRSEYRLLLAMNTQAEQQLDVAEQVRNLEARYAELRAAVDATSKKIDEATLAATAPPVVPEKARSVPKASQSNGPSELPVWLEVVCLVGVVLLLAWGLSRWQRQRSRADETAPDSETDSENGDATEADDATKLPDDSFAALLARDNSPAVDDRSFRETQPLVPRTGKATLASAQSGAGDRMSITEPVKESIEVNHVLEGEDSESAIELAGVLMAFGREKGAVQVLTEYLDAHPDTSLLPWLKLLEITRTSDMKDDFALWSERLKAHFNVAPMSWEDAGECFAQDFSPLAEGDLSIEDVVARLPIASTLGHVREGIVTNWDTEQGLDYLRKLLRDTRDGQRLGLPLPLAREVSFLFDLLESRLEQREVTAPAPLAVVQEAAN